MSPGFGRSAAGFTLIEMMIVLAIILVAGGLGFSSYQSVMPGYRSTGAARKISFELMAARGNAIRLSQDLIVFFDLTGGPDGAGQYKIQTEDPPGGCNNLGALPGCFTGGDCSLDFNSAKPCLGGGTLSSFTGTAFGVPLTIQPKLSRPFQFVSVNGSCSLCDASGNCSAYSNASQCALRITSDGHFRDLGGLQDLTGYVAVLPQVDIGGTRCDRTNLVMLSGTTGAVRAVYAACQ